MPHSTLIAACALLTVAGAATTIDEDPRSAGAVALRLTEVKEVRLTSLAPEAEGAAFFDRPGLTLTFGLSLPKGATLIELQEPTSIRAVDSTGADLSLIEPGFSGERDYIDVIHQWEGEAKEATLTLALPQRAATTVSLQAQLSATICAGTMSVDLPAASTPTPVKASVPGFPGAKLHLEHKPGAQPQIIITPGTVKPWIENIALIAGGVEQDSGSAMWSDHRLVYYFEAAPAAGATVRLTIRRDLRDVPVTLDLTSVPLP